MTVIADVPPTFQTFRNFLLTLSGVMLVRWKIFGVSKLEIASYKAAVVVKS